MLDAGHAQDDLISKRSMLIFLNPVDLRRFDSAVCTAYWVISLLLLSVGPRP